MTAQVANETIIVRVIFGVKMDPNDLEMIAKFMNDKELTSIKLNRNLNEILFGFVNGTRKCISLKKLDK